MKIINNGENIFELIICSTNNKKLEKKLTTHHLILGAFNVYSQMKLVQVNWRHGVRYILYDEQGKVVIITRNKKVALHYANTNETV